MTEQPKEIKNEIARKEIENKIARKLSIMCGIAGVVDNPKLKIPDIDKKGMVTGCQWIREDLDLRLYDALLGGGGLEEFASTFEESITGGYTPNSREEKLIEKYIRLVREMKDLVEQLKDYNQ